MRDPDDPSDSRGSLSSFAYTTVLELIMTHEIRSGEPIVESRLATELGISRTPLREALQRLDGEGILIRGERSFSVKVVDLGDFVQAMQVREMLESEAAFLAAGAEIPRAKLDAVRHQTEEEWRPEASPQMLWHLDNALHDLVLDHCDNGAMVKAVRQVRNMVRLYAQPYLRRRLSDRVTLSKAEHMRILDALEAADPKAARKAMTAHIRSLARDKLGRFG